MPKDFISDAEMAELESKGEITTPKFIPESEASKYFGEETQEPQERVYTSAEKMTGKAPSSGLAEDIFQSTLGYKGILGAGMIPGRVATNIILGDAGQVVEKGRGQLAEINTALIRKLRTLAPDDPKRTLLEQAITKNQQTLGMTEDVFGDIESTKITSKEVAGTTLNALLTLAPTGAIGGKVVVGQGLKTFAKTAGRRALTTGGIFGGYGVAEGLQKRETTQEIAKRGAIGFGIGSILSGVFSLGKAGIFGAGRKFLPKILSYTADVPEEAINRAMNSPIPVKEATKEAAKKGIEPTLQTAQQGVRQMRKNLSKEYGEGIQALIDQFSGKRVGLSETETKFVKKVAAEAGIEVPKNLQSLSFNEAMNFYKTINELFSSKAIRESASGVGVRQLKDSFKNVIVNNFGGKEGPVQQLLTNYAKEKTVHDAMDNIVRAYVTGKPNLITAASNRLRRAFDEGNGAYLKAITDFEQSTGVNLLDRLAGYQFRQIIPQKSGKFGFDELFRLLFAPVTSPRAVGAYARTLGKVREGVASPLLEAGKKIFGAM